MKKHLTYLFLYLPFSVLGQSEISPVTIWQKCLNLYSEGKLDSVVTGVSYFNEHAEKADTTRQFYVHPDTATLQNGYYAIGHSIIDRLMEFNSRPLGEWTYYYPSGKIYAKGKFTPGSYIECNVGGPAVIGYCFKTGNWTYWSENGDIVAEGDYEPVKHPIENNCGTVYLIVSKGNVDKWRFRSIDDNKKEEKMETLEKPINGL